MAKPEVELVWARAPPLVSAQITTAAPTAHFERSTIDVDMRGALTVSPTRRRRQEP
jgi:hypothetical protein